MPQHPYSAAEAPLVRCWVNCSRCTCMRGIIAHSAADIGNKSILSPLPAALLGMCCSSGEQQCYREKNKYGSTALHNNKMQRPMDNW